MKMRSFAALLLIVLLVLTATASAEGSVLRTLRQDKFTGTVFIDPACYPEVCLAPNYWVSSGVGYYEPWQVRFPCPAGTFATEFDHDSAFFCAVDSDLQYYYQAMDSYSYETMLNKCDNDDWIVEDGSNGTAIYVDPTKTKAFGLIGMKEIAKGAKLYLTVYDPSLKLYSDEEIISALADKMRGEMERISSSVVIEQNTTWWSEGCFDAVSVFDPYFPSVSVTMNLLKAPKMDDAQIPEPEFFVAKVNDAEATMYAFYEQDRSDDAFKLEINFESYSYPSYKLEEKDPDASTITLDNGATCLLYLHRYDDKAVTMWYASVEACKDKNDRMYYFNIQADVPYKHRIEDDSAIIAYINAVVANTVIDTNATLPIYRDYEPYTGVTAAAPVAAASEPAAAPAEQGQAAGGLGGMLANLAEVAKNSVEGSVNSGAAAAAPAAAEGWTCPSCNAVNGADAKFCPSCGTPRPAEGWTCPSCNAAHGADVNFCPNDGTKRPE